MLKGFLSSAKKFPNHVALIVNRKQFTYDWLLKKANAITKELINKEGQGHSLVGLYTDNNEYTYASLIAILLAGKGFVPLNHKFPDERLKKISLDAGIKTIVHDAISTERVNVLLPMSSLPVNDLELCNETISYAPSDEQVVYILFTSGSTGIPKGIPITNKNFEALLQALDKRYQLTENDKVLQAFELSFDVSLACTFIAWQYGCSVIVPDMDGIVAVNSFKAILDYGATFVTIPPSAIFYLKKLKILGAVKIPTVHTTLFTGEALPYKLAEDWKTSAENTIIENAYGPTETTVWCLFYKLDNQTEEQTINGLCPIGEGLDGVYCRIVDENHNLVNDNEKGELLVAGDQIFANYWNNTEKSEQAFCVDDKGVRWYKTGDVVLKNKSGNIVYINRKDNQVQINGFRVELSEVEHAIKKVSGMDGVVVLAKQTPELTELYAFIEGEFEKIKLLNDLKTILPFYMIPRDVTLVNPLPINTNGKIDKQKLQATYLS